jgi:molybdenum cofactor biosynthesis enzyme MoaA
MNPTKEEMFRPGVTSPVSSMSIVIGDAVRSRCNGRCPFCISRLSNALGIHADSIDKNLINWDTVMPKFRAACRFAKTAGVTNILLTGRGEPTLYKHEIDRYLMELAPYEFPFIELQTNGINLRNAFNVRKIGFTDLDRLSMWRDKGLTHIAVSIAHWDMERNNEIYRAKEAVDLEDLFGELDRFGFSVRTCLVLMKDYVDSIRDFDGVVGLCKAYGAKQLRIASLGKTSDPESSAVAQWIDNHLPEHAEDIINHVSENGHYLRTLPHGAPIFDYHGLSVCIADCMPKDNRVGNGMQPIFWPNGSLTYSWEWKGAVLL